jgi:5'-3' exonuclease
MKMTKIMGTDVSWCIERNLSVLQHRYSGDELVSAVADLTLRQHFQYATLHKTRHFIAIMDGGNNFRYKVYPLYKHSRASYVDGAGRTLSADEVKAGILSNALENATRERSATHDCRDYFKDLCLTLGVPVFHMRRYEGDDGLASLGGYAKENKGVKAIMVTPDKDIVQAINASAVQWRPAMGAKVPAMTVSLENFDARLAKIVSTKSVGWTPDQFLDWQILKGDDIDDIPRLINPGEATKAINAHGSLSKYHKAMIQETRAKDAAPLFSQADVERNIQLVTLKRDLFAADTPLDAFLVRVDAKTKLPKGLHHYTGSAVGDWIRLPPATSKLSLFNR